MQNLKVVMTAGDKMKYEDLVGKNKKGKGKREKCSSRGLKIASSGL